MVRKLLEESYEKALELLRENRQVMDRLAEYLIEKETITGKEFMKIYRQEKGLPEPEEEKKEENKEKVQESEVPLEKKTDESEEPITEEIKEKKEETAQPKGSYSSANPEEIF